MPPRFGRPPLTGSSCCGRSSSGKVKVNVSAYKLDERLEGQKELMLYRMIQELISNALKHAGAKEIMIQLHRYNGTLSVMVEDDGKGFDTVILQQSKGIGWTNIQHRVEFLKGKLDVISQGGKGTSVHIEFNI